VSDSGKPLDTTADFLLSQYDWQPEDDHRWMAADRLSFCAAKIYVAGRLCWIVE
jgi:hypothetical protein